MVLCRAVQGRRDSPNRDLLEVIVGGVVVCALSNEIREEVTEVLARPVFGSMTPAGVDSLLQPVWDAARWVELGPDDPRYARFVGDNDDVHILRTAVGTFFHTDLASLPKKFIVSADRKAFPQGTNWYGFECCSATNFMPRLRDALE